MKKEVLVKMPMIMMKTASKQMVGFWTKIWFYTWWIDWFYWHFIYFFFQKDITSSFFRVKVPRDSYTQE